MVDLDNVPEWMAAIGSVSAAAVALWLLYVQLRIYRTSEQDRIQRDATRVSVWWSYPGVEGEKRVGRFRRKRIKVQQYAEVAVNVRNSGENPVYDCIVYLGPSREPPVEGGREDAWDFHFRIVPAGETLTMSAPREYFVLEPQDHEPDEHGFYKGAWVEMVFTDSAGRHWRRTKRGELVQRKGPSVES